jgi:UDP-galactopyranose mutase
VVADLVCFSHLRWDFVYQRPNHLMARAARERRVLFVEEPFADAPTAHLERRTADGVEVVVPHVPVGSSQAAVRDHMRRMIHGLVRHVDGRPPVFWYLTPMALEWSDDVPASAVIYDCMDELTAFRESSPPLRQLEERLFARADLVFTGGMQLYLSKRTRHKNVHLFPSSVDVKHFARARVRQPDPADQAGIPRPRLGYFGVIDERMDMDLIARLAEQRPDLQIVLLGPVAKIDPADLPIAANIHALGAKPYADLPRYLAGWDVGIMPFAHNDATRFISPTKTPEYLAGGRPVASTSIRDVVEPYGTNGLAHIGDGVDGFISAVERALAEDPAAWVERADAFLGRSSWDRTWSQMSRLIHSVADGDPAAGIDRAPLPRVAVAMGETRASVAVGARPSSLRVPAVRTQD